jgi:hypothetical protein
MIEKSCAVYGGGGAVPLVNEGTRTGLVLLILKRTTGGGSLRTTILSFWIGLEGSRVRAHLICHCSSISGEYYIGMLSGHRNATQKWLFPNDVEKGIFQKEGGLYGEEKFEGILIDELRELVRA